jgi:hypothetical protein
MTTVKDRLITFKNSLITAKNNLATAITAKGVTASGSDSFDSLVTKVNSIPSLDYDLYAIRGYKFFDEVKVGGLTIINGSTGTTMTTDKDRNKVMITSNNTGVNNIFTIIPPEIENHTDAVLLDFILALNLAESSSNYANSSNYGIITYLPPTDSSTFDSIVQTREVTINYTLNMDFIYAVTSEGNGMIGYTVGSKAYIDGLGTKNTVIHVVKPSSTYEYMQKMYLFNGTFAYKKA